MSKAPSGISITDEDMYYIIVACRSLRMFSKCKTREKFFEFLEKQELFLPSKNKMNWRKPDLKALKRIEDSFTERMKYHNLILPFNNE